jgi:hypothetical protein
MADFSGDVVKPLKFEGKNVQVECTFKATYKLTSGTKDCAGRLIAALNEFLGKRRDTLEAAVTSLEQMVEKMLKEAEALWDEGKGTAALAKVKEAAAFKNKWESQITPFVNGTKADTQKVLDAWWATEQKGQADLRNAKIEAAAMATLKISSAAIAAAAGIASAVVTAGGAVPIAGASVGAAVKVLSSAYTNVKTAMEGFPKAYEKLQIALVKAQAALDKLAVKSTKPDKGTLDKIKAAMAGSPIKDLEDALKNYKVKIQDTKSKMDSYNKAKSQLADKSVALEGTVKKSKNKDYKKQEEMIGQKMDYIDRKFDLLIRTIDKAEAVAAEAEKVIKEGKAGNYAGVIGKKWDKVDDQLPLVSELAGLIENVYSLASNWVSV